VTKGVVLSHYSHRHVTQFTVMLDAGPEDSSLPRFPSFHSFGCTVTLWVSADRGHANSHLSESIGGGKDAALVEKHKITGATATPTFLRAYLRKAEPEQLRSGRLVIVGAGKDAARSLREIF